MRNFFFAGIIGLILFEIANVYFIMPMPGSQRLNSIDAAYFLYSWRWVLRVLFGVLIVVGISPALRQSKWLAVAGLVAAAGLTYAVNFRMAADHTYYQPGLLTLKSADYNTVKPDREVLGVELNGQAKAYPIQYIGYHHQVLDTLGGQPILVTYCTVCRTGRVFRPIVQGKPETFRLVGMDHFNAMFEDAHTGSWWRQANGEAIAGRLKGDTLPEVFSEQMTLKQWMTLHPTTLVMQPDRAYNEVYARMSGYELGKGNSDLTKRDSLSWHDKSWIVGVTVGKHARAYDWNRLSRERLIHDTLGGQPILLVLARDNRSFFAYERSAAGEWFALRHDTLTTSGYNYALSGDALSERPALARLPVHQEFWHSWRQFHPTTSRY